MIPKNKRTFNLVTGIPAQVTELTGLEQKLLTENKNHTPEERNILLLGSILHSVGEFDLSTMSAKDREDFIRKMPSADRKKALCEARQFSNDFDPIFDFLFEYTSCDPTKGKQSQLMEINLGSGSFPCKPVGDFNEKMLQDKEGNPLTKMRDIMASLDTMVPKVFSNYQEVLDNMYVFFSVPKSKLRIRMRMLDAAGEARASATKEDQRSSHTTLIMRNVCYQTDNSTNWISFTAQDLDKLPAFDLEVMRIVRKYVEGNVDSEIQFEHPEANRLPADKKTVTVDLLSQLSFFFQSGII